MSKQRLIDANALLSDQTNIAEFEYDECCKDEFVSVDAIRDAPTVDAVPAVHGEWVDTYADDKEIGDFVKHCSICHNAIIKRLSASLNYCPNCGAKMEDKACG